MKFVALIPIVCLAGCGLGIGERPRDVVDRSLAGRYARIVIPESATNFHCRTEKGIDRLTYGRFDIPANDLKQLLSQMPADGKHHAYELHSNVDNPMAVAWRQPGQLQNRRIIEWSLPSFGVHMLYGDTGSSESITVYFYNFEL